MDEYARRLSCITPGFSGGYLYILGADISNLCNESAILAARNKSEFVNQKDFELSSEKIIAGIEKKRLVDPLQRKVKIHFKY